MFGFVAVTTAQYGRVFQNMVEFADVSRPAVSHEPLLDPALHVHDLFVKLPAEMLKKVAGEKGAKKLLDKHFRPIDGHKWYFEGMSTGQLDTVRKGFESRYGKGSLK